MAVFGEVNPPLVAPEEDPVTVKGEPPGYDGIAVNTEYVADSALLTWAEGYTWRVDYYSQFLGQGSEQAVLDIGTSPVDQQYKLLKQMDIRVSDPLSFATDTPANVANVRGTAYSFPFLRPQVHDVFVANIGDGRLGVFTIDAVRQRTIFRNSVYEIDYKLLTELDQVYITQLEQKTIHTLYYSYENLVQGAGPFLTEKGKERKSSYTRVRRELIDGFFINYSRQLGTLLVPDQLQRTYDPMMVKFILRHLNSDEHKDVRNITQYNVEKHIAMGQPTILDAISAMNAQELLYGISERAHLVNTSVFQNHPTLQPISHVNIARVVYPLEVAVGADAQYRDLQSTQFEGIAFSEGKPIRPAPGIYVSQQDRNTPWFDSPEFDDELEPWELTPDIHPVSIDDYYVLSEHFYRDNVSGQSKLEMLIYQLIRRQPLNLQMLDALLVDTNKWDGLERFYYYPLLWLLLKVGALHE